MSQEPQVKTGDVVRYEEEKCRVLKRRRVTGMAMFQTSEFEVFLESLDGEQVGWVAENEVETISGQAGGA